MAAILSETDSLVSGLGRSVQINSMSPEGLGQLSRAVRVAAEGSVGEDAALENRAGGAMRRG